MFVDPTGSPRDLHIISGSDATDAGADLSGDANLPFSDDIDLDARSGSWNIGSDENTVPAGLPGGRKLRVTELRSRYRPALPPSLPTTRLGSSSTMPVW